jgi:hypothetical protein
MYQKFLFKTLILTVLVAALALAPAMAGGASASSHQPVGEQINVLIGFPTTFAAGQPFNIRHGHGVDADADAIGVYEFKLQVDGAYVREAYVDRSVNTGDPDTLIRLWVFNFPNGMTGAHTFVGHWLGPCYASEGSCTQPNAQVELFATTLAVTFGP